MPLVRIDLAEGKAPEYGIQAGQIVYQALSEVMKVPQGDLFQIITQHPQSGLQFDRDYLGVHRSETALL